MTGKTPAGWYDSTTRPGERRYWNGRAWTDAFSFDGVSRLREQSPDEPPPPALQTADHHPLRWLIWVWTAVGVVVLVGAAALVWSLIPTTVTLDPTQVESEIRAWITRNEMFAGDVAVSCPSSMTGEPGDRFVCTLDGDAAAGYHVTVSIDNDDGYYSYGLS